MQKHSQLGELQILYFVQTQEAFNRHIKPSEVILQVTTKISINSFMFDLHNQRFLSDLFLTTMNAKNVDFNDLCLQKKNILLKMIQRVNYSFGCTVFEKCNDVYFSLYIYIIIYISFFFINELLYKTDVEKQIYPQGIFWRCAIVWEFHMLSTVFQGLAATV